ncbi:MAG: hypothetical protein KC486_13840 [Myxococcales bacterium]|nr:hypothetical protein [Myxococcales bacterium]
MVTVAGAPVVSIPSLVDSSVVDDDWSVVELDVDSSAVELVVELVDVVAVPAVAPSSPEQPLMRNGAPTTAMRSGLRRRGRISLRCEL